MYLTNQQFSESEFRKFLDYLQKNKNGYVCESMKIIEECFKSIKFRLNEICLSFNGGKDCTVVLYLIKCFIFKNLESFKAANDQLVLNTIYIRPTDEFEEVEKFIQFSSKFFQLNLIKYDNNNIKKSLTQFKQSGIFICLLSLAVVYLNFNNFIFSSFFDKRNVQSKVKMLKSFLWASV